MSDSDSDSESDSDCPSALKATFNLKLLVATGKLTRISIEKVRSGMFNTVLGQIMIYWYMIYW